MTQSEKIFRVIFPVKIDNNNNNKTQTTFFRTKCDFSYFPYYYAVYLLSITSFVQELFLLATFKTIVLNVASCQYLILVICQNKSKEHAIIFRAILNNANGCHSVERKILEQHTTMYGKIYIIPSQFGFCTECSAFCQLGRFQGNHPGINIKDIVNGIVKSLYTLEHINLLGIFSHSVKKKLRLFLRSKESIYISFVGMLVIYQALKRVGENICIHFKKKEKKEKQGNPTISYVLNDAKRETRKFKKMITFSCTYVWNCPPPTSKITDKLGLNFFITIDHFLHFEVN